MDSENMDNRLDKNICNSLSSKLDKNSSNNLDDNLYSNINNNFSDSLYKRLVKYSDSDYYPFHMPGHKRNTDIINMISPYKIDITEIENFDNLHNANDVIKSLMNRIAKMYGSKRSYILVNGSTCGIMAAISSVVKMGDEIALARNCHKSVYNAVYINKLKCNYIVPKVNEYGIFGQIEIEDVEEIFNRNPKVKVVVITSPTYEGIVSDIEGIAKYVHKKGGILIVDEAHGAHFKFDNYFPTSAVELGADIVIESIHKTLPAMTQTSILHICSENIDEKKVERFLSIYESSSPSYVLMASVEKCMDIIDNGGKKLFNEYVNRLEKIYSQCSKLKCLSIFKPEQAFDFDRGKINIVSRRKGYTGTDLYNELLNKYHLQMEMASEKYVIAMTSICDTDDGIDRLVNALKEIDLRLQDTEDVKTQCIESNRITESIIIPEKLLEAYEMDFRDNEEILFTDSENRISGTYVYLYPPGCPILVPGELITKELIAKVNKYMEEGLNVTGLRDNKIVVVNNTEIK